MNSGYYAAGDYYCSGPCLDAHISPEEWEELYEEGGDDYYYSEWTPEDADVEFYDDEGSAHPLPTDTLAPCPYCEATGEGDYWTHGLQGVVSFTCHACNGSATVERQGELARALDDAGDDRRAKYAALYPELMESTTV
jgi:hypothetical protein